MAALREELAVVELNPRFLNQLKQLNDSLDTAVQNKDLERAKFLREQILAISNEQLLKEDEILQKIREQNEAARLAKLESEGSFFEGITEGIKKLNKDLPGAFTVGLEFIRSAVVGLGDFIAQTLVNAFDPTDDSSIKERFARFLQQLSLQLLKSAFLQILLSLIPGGGAAAGAAGAVGRHEGGSIPDSGGASPAHFRHPRGLHTGGDVSGRPRGVHPKDTVPIWAQPGEFMMKFDAVRTYGLAFMQKLNAGVLNPATLQGLAASTGRTLSTRPKGPGFQTGGQIPASQAPPAGAGGTVVLPVLAADEITMESLLEGGAPAMREFMRENNDETRSGA